MFRKIVRAPEREGLARRAIRAVTASVEPWHGRMTVLAVRGYDDCEARRSP